MNTKKQFVNTVTALNAGSSEPSMVVSTETPDRDHDRVLADGIKFQNFLRNPVLLWSHQHRDIPIGSVTSLAIEAGRGVRARWRWLENDEFASRVKNAWDQGVVRAASIGFAPTKWRANTFRGLDYTESELLEISLTPIPANPAAVRALKAFGLDDSAFDDEDWEFDLDDLEEWDEPGTDLGDWVLDGSVFRPPTWVDTIEASVGRGIEEAQALPTMTEVEQSLARVFTKVRAELESDRMQDLITESVVGAIRQAQGKID